MYEVKAEPLKPGRNKCVMIHYRHLFKRQTLVNRSHIRQHVLSLNSRKAMQGQWKHMETNPTSAEMRLFPLFLRQTPVGDCTSSEEVPDAWSLSPSDPIFRFSWTISGLENKRMTGWVCLWETGQVSAPADDFSRKEKHSLGHFYEPPCSYWAPGYVEERTYTTSTLGLINLTDRFNLRHCHGALQDKSIHHTVSMPKQTQVSYIESTLPFLPAFMFILGNVMNLNIVSGLGHFQLDFWRCRTHLLTNGLLCDWM